jgi:hypothetical protein
MTEYVGTISSMGTFSGTGVLSGYTATITQTDNATAILNINPTSFAGTIDQVITTSGTVSLGPISAPFTDTEDTGALTLTGTVSQPTTLTFTETGTIDSLPYTVSVTETLQLSGDQSSISISGTETADLDGTRETITFSGQLKLLLEITSSGGVTSQPVQMISGTGGLVGATVTVFDGTTQVGTAKVQADGDWSVGVTLLNGVQTITAETSSSVSNAVSYTFSATAPAEGILESLTPPEEISGIYVGYFNRAPDAGGFSFWEGQYTQALANGQFKDEALQNIANSFTPQNETLALYPFLATQSLNPNSPTDVSGVENLIVNVYTNLFDRTPPVTDGGVQYWANQILDGQIPLGNAILDIANGALGADADTVLNKVIVSDYFAAQDTAANIGLTSPLPATLLPEAHAILMGVTSDPATVATAETSIDAFVAGTASVITGTLNNETLTGGSTGGDIIYPAGGADTINLSSAAHATETIYFGATVNASATVIEPITNAAGVTQQGFWGNASGDTGLSASTSADMTVVNNFAAGATGDIVSFIFSAWGSGGTVNGTGTELGLVQGDAATPVTTGSAVLGALQVAGTTLSASTNVVVDSVATYANAAALASALTNSSGHFSFTGAGLAANDDAHMLVAYSTGSSVDIADVEFDNTTTAGQSDTAHLTVTASDMVQLIGVSLAALTAHNIALVAG